MSIATIGTALAEKRRQYGLEKGQAADRIGMSRTTYSSYEQDSQRPSVDVFPALAKFLDVSMEELLDLYGATCVAAVRPSLERLLSSHQDADNATEGAAVTTTPTDDILASVEGTELPTANEPQSSLEWRPNEQAVPEYASGESEPTETPTRMEPRGFDDDDAVEERWGRPYAHHGENWSASSSEILKPSIEAAEPATPAGEPDLAGEREVILFTSYDPLPSSITTVKAESREKESHHKKKKKKKKKN